MFKTYAQNTVADLLQHSHGIGKFHESIDLTDIINYAKWLGYDVQTERIYQKTSGATTGCEGYYNVLYLFN